MPIKNKASLIELAAALMIAAIFLPLVWSSSGATHSSRLKVHTYTNCYYAPLLRIYSVPDENSIHGYCYDEPSLQVHGCTEILTIASHPIEHATYHEGGKDRSNLSVNLANDKGSAYYFHFYKKERSGLPRFEIKGKFISPSQYSTFLLDNGMFDMRTKGWTSEVSTFVYQSRPRETTRIRYGLSGDYEILESNPSENRIDSKKKRDDSLGYAMPSQEYAFDLPGNGSSI